AHRQTNLAWDATLTQLESLRPVLVAAGSRDPSFEAELASLFTLMTTRNVIAQRGVARRRARHAARRAAPNKAASTPPTSTPSNQPLTNGAAPPALNVPPTAGGAHA
ncbi:MAG: hypothetical protein ACHREM_27975, partial [Polyangiales bacterium]